MVFSLRCGLIHLVRVKARWDSGVFTLMLLMGVVRAVEGLNSVVFHVKPWFCY